MIIGIWPAIKKYCTPLFLNNQQQIDLMINLNKLEHLCNKIYIYNNEHLSKIFLYKNLKNP